MKRLMSGTTGRGRELFELLAREFALPECVQEFEVSFHLDGTVICRCTWLAAELDEDEKNVRLESRR
ncbi:hypothetical protein [Burkholderia ambifaria]